MGRWFQRFFAAQGLEVLVGRPGHRQTPQEVAALADVVMLSVPIPKVVAIVHGPGPPSPPRRRLDGPDFGEAAPPGRHAQAHFPGEVVGTHPLFGPGAKSIAGRTVVLCPGRGERWFNWLKDLLERAGARVKVTTRHGSRPPHGRGPGVVPLCASSPWRWPSANWGSPSRTWRISPRPPFPPCTAWPGASSARTPRCTPASSWPNPANRPALRALDDAVADILYFIQRQNADGLVRLLEEIKEGFGR